MLQTGMICFTYFIRHMQNKGFDTPDVKFHLKDMSGRSNYCLLSIDNFYGLGNTPFKLYLPHYHVRCSQILWLRGSTRSVTGNYLERRQQQSELSSSDNVLTQEHNQNVTRITVPF